MRGVESGPIVVDVLSDSIAESAGIIRGDEIVTVNGVSPRDVIEWRLLTDASVVDIQVLRGGMIRDISIDKVEGESLGLEVSSAVFDRVRTCDNHCPFCFIYQLPAGMRKSLYLKDDDYRLSFLYGNFTTLTRFTESDFERIVDEGLSPLNVSIHSTNPHLRSSLLRNNRGSVSLRWLKQLLKSGIRVNGQIVVCPGINDGVELERTLIGILDEYPDLSSLAVVPLGISRFNPETSMRAHTAEEALDVLEIVEDWQRRFLDLLGRRLVHAADEYYIMAGRDFPNSETYEGFSMHEDGIGMARTFEMEFRGLKNEATGTASGFFAWVDGAPPEGYRAVRNPASDTGFRHKESCNSNVAVQLRKRSSNSPICVLTGEYGAVVLEPLLAGIERSDVRIRAIPNSYFGGNIGVAGLLVGQDIAAALDSEPIGHRYLLPDVCLSEGRFLDGTSPEDLPRMVEIVPTDGISLRRILEERA